MYAEIATALSSVKTISDLTSLILKSKVTDAVRDNSIELQSAVIALQTAITGIQAQNYELLNENNQLKQQLADLKKWETEAQKYTLEEIAPGVLAYVFKSGPESITPIHWLCANCYQNKEKSILQRGRKSGVLGTPVSCPRCKTHLRI
jgi:hypothetical protein